MIFSKDEMHRLESAIMIRARRRNIIAKNPSDAPLTQQEQQVFAILRRHYEKKAMQQRGIGPQEAHAAFEELLGRYSPRQVVAIELDRPEVYGVHYMWFVVTAICCFAFFIRYDNIVALTSLAFTMHIGGVIYHQATKKNKREQLIHSILTKGIDR